MIYICAILLNMRCPHCTSKPPSKNELPYTNKDFKKRGFYRRKSDSRIIQRLYCKRCKKTYSHAWNDPAFNQKKRRVNYPLKQMLASCVSQRRAAKLLGISRTTVARKLIYLGTLCRDKHEQFLDSQHQQIDYIQFDECQTIEHTKCKPLSIAVAVAANNRKILGMTVSSMPATGHLAAIARKKYGKRPDHRIQGLKILFKGISKSLTATPTIHSDEHPYYKPIINQFFPKARYIQSKGVASAVTGQGELKKTRHDPLFAINHTLAMLRANVNRLVRKTWCTTKKPERLADHLAIYMDMHNVVLTV